MSYLGDTLTVGLVLVLLFGSIALYLYTRIQQTEQKVSLLESIVLDLKLTGELPSFGGLPSHDHTSVSLLSPISLSGSSNSSNSVHLSVVEETTSDYKPFEEKEEQEEQEEHKKQEENKKQEEQEEHEEHGENKVEQHLEHLPLEEVHTLPVQEEVSFVSASLYDGLSLKELQGVVRARGLLADKGVKKGQLIELLKRADANSTPTSASEVKPGSTSSSSFLETSASLLQDAE